MGKQKKSIRNMSSIIAAFQHQKEMDKLYNVAREESVIVTLGLVFEALTTEFWEDTAKEKIPVVLKEFLSLYDAYIRGIVSLAQLSEFIKETSGTEIQLTHIRLTHDGQWKKVERLGNASRNMKRKSVEDYQKEKETLTEMYEFCKEHLQSTIKRKNASEAKKEEAEEKIKRFTEYYENFVCQMEDACFIDSGTEFTEETARRY